MSDLQILVVSAVVLLAVAAIIIPTAMVTSYRVRRQTEGDFDALRRDRNDWKDKARNAENKNEQWAMAHRKALAAKERAIYELNRIAREYAQVRNEMVAQASAGQRAAHLELCAPTPGRYHGDDVIIAEVIPNVVKSIPIITTMGPEPKPIGDMSFTAYMAEVEANLESEPKPEPEAVTQPMRRFTAGPRRKQRTGSAA